VIYQYLFKLGEIMNGDKVCFFWDTV